MSELPDAFIDWYAYMVMQTCFKDIFDKIYLSNKNFQLTFFLLSVNVFEPRFLNLYLYAVMKRRPFFMQSNRSVSSIQFT